MKYYKCVNCFYLIVDGGNIPEKCPKCKADNSYVGIGRDTYNILFKQKMERSDKDKYNK